MIALALLGLSLQASVPQEVTRAESLLTAGRTHFAGRVVGRYAALEAFRAAARLAPSDPEPLYGQVQVGFYLGSDEGEVIARDALLRIMAIDPDYADVWDRFRTLYHNPDIWRRADRALALHPDNAVAMERRAEFAIALEQPQRADSLLGVVQRVRGVGVSSCLLRAEADFLAGGDSAGYRWYDSALVHADVDSTGAMWDRVWMIATPAEAAEHEATDPGERRAFFERFWARRDPNLLTPANERIAEHFRRLAYARRHFRLLHPMNLYHRSAIYRSLLQSFDRDFTEQLALHELEPYPGADNDRRFAQGEGTAAAVAGFDARGLIYLRHGRPDRMLRGSFDPLRPLDKGGSSLDVEGWLYNTPDGPLTIGFRRGTSLGGGDFIFVPTSRRQVVSTQVALRTDRTTLPAPLVAHAWTALFRSAELGLTDVYYRTSGDSAAAVLWDTAGRLQPVRASGAGLLQLSIPPGTYHAGVDVDSAGELGRWRRDVFIPSFSAVELGLSSFVLAPSALLLDREPALREMPVDLVYPAGTPLASYVEIYGLTADQSGRSHYHLRYSFAPVRSFLGRLFSNTRVVVFEFDRETQSSTSFERLIIEPDRLPSGRYRVTLAVTDLARNVKSESVALEIEIR